MRCNSHIRPVFNRAAALLTLALSACGGGGGGGSSTPVLPPSPKPSATASSAPQNGVADMTIALSSRLVMTQAASVQVDVTAYDAYGHAIGGAYPSAITLTDSDTTGRTQIANATLTASGQAATLSYTGKADQFTITATAGSIVRSQTFSTVLPPETPMGLGIEPQHMTFAPDGSLWGSFLGGVSVGKINADGSVSGTSDPSEGSDNEVFAIDGSGNAWIGYHDSFHETQGIDRLTPGGSPAAFPFPSTWYDAHVNSVMRASDGTIWFAADGWNPYESSYIAHADSAGNLTAVATIPQHAQNLVYGPDGNYWFSSADDADVYKMTPGGVVTSYSFGYTGVTNLHFIVGPDGNFWAPFAFGTTSLLKFNTSGVVVSTTTMPSLYTQQPRVTDLAEDGGGNVYALDAAGEDLVRITPSGSVAEYPIYTALSYPQCIAAAADGTAYVSDTTSNTMNGGIGGLTRVDPSLW